MNASRLPLRSIGRVNRIARPAKRFQSTNPSSPATASPPRNNHALIGGLAGGAAAFTLGYAWYHFSGAKTIVNAASQTRKYYQSATEKLKESSPEPNQALQWLKETSLSYAAFIPGGKHYVEKAFKDLDAVREKHGDKVDGIVRDAYSEIRDATKTHGLSLETAQQVWTIIEKRLGEVAKLGGDASDIILENHPGLKDKIGGRIDELKSMRDHYGPEAKEQIDKTWDQISSVVSKGFGANTISEVKDIIEEKIKVVKKLADDAFDKGLQQAQPYLEKSPKVKKLVEDNKEALKKGDVNQLWKVVQEAASSGDASSVEQFVKKTTEKASSSSSSGSGGGMESVLKQIPGAETIAPQLSKLFSLAQEHGHEAKDLASSTIKEIEEVLRKKVSEAEKIAENARNK